MSLYQRVRSPVLLVFVAQIFPQWNFGHRKLHTTYGLPVTGWICPNMAYPRIQWFICVFSIKIYNHVTIWWFLWSLFSLLVQYDYYHHFSIIFLCIQIRGTSPVKSWMQWGQLSMFHKSCPRKKQKLRHRFTSPEFHVYVQLLWNGRLESWQLSTRLVRYVHMYICVCVYIYNYIICVYIYSYNM